MTARAAKKPNLWDAYISYQIDQCGNMYLIETPQRATHFGNAIRTEIVSEGLV